MIRNDSPSRPRAVSNNGFRLALATAVVAGLASSTALAASEKLVIEAGRVIQHPGNEIQDGVIVIENGRITAVGKKGEVEVPWDAPVVGGPTHVAVPGFVEALTSSGMDRANENIDVAPFLDVRDSIDPINVSFEDFLRWGVTTINVQQGTETVVGARGRIVQPHGLTIEEMTVRPLHGLVISASPKRGKSRATQAQTLRAAFGDLRRYLEEIVADAQDGGDKARREALYQGRDLEGEKAEGRAMGGSAWKVEGLELIPRGAIDEKQEPLLDLIEGRYRAYIHCVSARDVHLAIEVATENGFLERTTLVVSGDCFKAAAVIKDTGAPVVIKGDLTYTETDPVSGEEIETDVLTAFREAGVTYAISSANTNVNSLWFRAVRAIATGADPVEAFDAVTRVPAEMLGLGDEVGSIETGKLGNIVLLTGDPLATDTWVDRVVLQGVAVYDRAEDTRNEYVIDGVEPIGIDAAPPVGDGN